MCTSDNDWESILISYKKTDNPLQHLDLTKNLGDDLDMSQQQKILSCLPNHHKWPFPDVKGLKHEQRFSSSTRRYPGSPRNRFVQAWNSRSDPYHIIYDILFNIFCGPKKVRYPEKRTTVTGQNPRKRKRTLAEVLGFLNTIERVKTFRLKIFFLLK